MGRKFNAERMEAIYETVQAYPGERAGAIARLLGVTRSVVNRTMVSMESRGYLLCEDERGGLWPFRKTSHS